MGPSWSHLGPSWGHLRATLHHLRLLWKASWTMLCHLRATLHIKPASGLLPVFLSLSLRKLSACFRLVFISLSVSSQLLSRLSTLLSIRVRLALSKLSSLLAFSFQLELAVGLPSACFQFALSSRSAYPRQALLVAFNLRSDSHPCSQLVFSLL